MMFLQLEIGIFHPELNLHFSGKALGKIFSEQHKMKQIGIIFPDDLAVNNNELFSN